MVDTEGNEGDKIMLNLRRIQALFLLVAVLVVSFGMFAPPAFSVTCAEAKTWCCEAIVSAQWVCNQVGTGSNICKAVLASASIICNDAADICGYIVAHDCFGG